jgi:hypothetical protein
MQFYKRTKGHLGQHEDWYYYNKEARTVTHRWDHVTVGNLKSNDGENEYTAKEFLEGDHYQPAKDALLKLLNSLN